jgi:hypothetical protein
MAGSPHPSTSKAALREELERLVAACDGPITRDNAPRVCVRCRICALVRMVMVENALRFKHCPRCGADIIPQW